MYQVRPNLTGPDPQLVPIAIKTFDQLLAYQRYLDLPAYRAFAVYENARHGFANNQVSMLKSD